MNILIVDDQLSVIHGLLSGIHFKDLGFTSVDTATSTAQALEILERKPIHVLMTDIEMPGPNGLELNSIVQKKYPDTLRIVLTSHAVFSYAQTSVKLGCFDYIVQPAPFEEIEAVLHRAVDAVRVHHNNRRIRQYGSLFKNHESEFLNAIILKLYSNDPEAQEECCHLLNQCGHPVRQDSFSQLIFVDVFAYTYQEPEYPRQQQIMVAITDALKSVAFFAANDPLVFLNPHRQFTILLLAPKGRFLPDISRPVAQFYQKLQLRLSGQPVACYYGDPFPFAEIQKAIKAANEHINNNVAREPLLSHIVPPKPLDDLHATLPDYLEHWGHLLYSGQKQLLKKEIDFCLDEKIATIPNRFQCLCQLHQQLLQLFFQYFYDNGIDIRSIFNEGFTYRDCMDSFSSIEDVKHTVSFLLEAADSAGENIPEADYVEKAKTFISENYSKPLSVKEVAEYVHLNPEYFTKLFKKETGKNIKNYIIDCKMTIAKELLETSNLPVSMVALEVGYNNFSHFAQFFKKMEKMTPSEYRLGVQNKKGSKQSGG